MKLALSFMLVMLGCTLARGQSNAEFSDPYRLSLDKSRPFRETVEAAHKALRFSESTGQDSLVQLAATQLGILHWNDGVFDSSLYFLSKGVRIASKRKDLAGKAVCRHYEGLVFYYKCSFDSALSLYDEAEGYYATLKLDSAVAKISSHKALIYNIVGDYGKAIDNLIASYKIQESMPGYRDHSIPLRFSLDAANQLYMRAKLDKDLESLGFVEKGNDLNKLAFTLSNIGKDYTHLREYPSAIRYLRKSCAVYEALSQQPHYQDLAGAYAESGVYDSAHIYFKKAIDQTTVRGTQIHLANIYSSVGHLFSRQGKWEDALKYMTLSRDLNTRMGMPRSESKDAEKRSSVLLQLRRTKEALDEIERSIRISTQIGILKDLSEQLKARANVLAALNRNSEALAAMQESVRLSTVISDGESQMQIARLQIEYESEKKGRDVEALRAQNLLKEVEIQNKNLLILTGLILIGMTVAVSTLIYSRYKSKTRTATILQEKNKQIELQNALLLKKAAEEEALLHEIHHRVKNNLQIISSLINLKVRQSSAETAEVLNQLNGRIFSMGLIHEKLFEKEQLQTVRMDEYLGELARHLTTSLAAPGTFQLTTDCEPFEADLEVAISCGLISNELITNSMKHAFPAEQQERQISLKFKSRNGNINFDIADNGCGSAEKRNGSKRSFGLRFVDQLVTSKLKGSWNITSENGFQASIVFPVI